MSEMTPEERYKKVKCLRESGLTYKAIGQQMGFGAERARQLYKKALRMEHYKEHEPFLLKQLEEARKHDARYVFKDYLPARAVNALWRYHINTLEELKATDPKKIIQMRNVGKTTFDLIMKVRGMDL